MSAKLRAHSSIKWVGLLHLFCVSLAFVDATETWFSALDQTLLKHEGA